LRAKDGVTISACIELPRAGMDQITNTVGGSPHSPVTAGFFQDDILSKSILHGNDF
jgi:hypothetical protein